MLLVLPMVWGCAREIGECGLGLGSGQSLCTGFGEQHQGLLQWLPLHCPDPLGGPPWVITIAFIWEEMVSTPHNAPVQGSGDIEACDAFQTCKAQRSHFVACRQHRGVTGAVLVCRAAGLFVHPFPLPFFSRRTTRSQTFASGPNFRTSSRFLDFSHGTGSGFFRESKGEQNHMCTFSATKQLKDPWRRSPRL